MPLQINLSNLYYFVAHIAHDTQDRTIDILFSCFFFTICRIEKIIEDLDRVREQTESSGLEGPSVVPAV